MPFFSSTTGADTSSGRRPSALLGIVAPLTLLTACTSVAAATLDSSTATPHCNDRHSQHANSG